MICYKIYSLVVAIFDFMHTTSMYVMYTLITDSLFYVVKNQTPKKLGADASPFIWALHSTLASHHSKGGILQKHYCWGRTRIFLIRLGNAVNFPGKWAAIRTKLLTAQSTVIGCSCKSYEQGFDTPALCISNFPQWTTHLVGIKSSSSCWLANLYLSGANSNEYELMWVSL
jgi:hypothetical protein